MGKGQGTNKNLEDGDYGTANTMARRSSVLKEYDDGEIDEQKLRNLFKDFHLK
jgi:hypothetical protein